MNGPVRTRQHGGSVVAYFSMEAGLESAIPTYAGGLGVLAGDTLRASADLGMPLIGVTLLHRKGYFRQRLDPQGHQREEPNEWRPEEHLLELPQRAAIELEGRRVHLRAWCYSVRGYGGCEVPVYLLDTMLPENDPEDQGICGELYGGDQRDRLRQEAVLGLGGVAMLRALGYRDITAYHMNEGHSALLTVALLREQVNGRHLADATAEDIAAVRERCVFTTHTPVPEGHDQFPLDLVRSVLGGEVGDLLVATERCVDGRLNMTSLALLYSRFINGVAMRHGQISRGMFPGYPIDSITNGVHAGTWTTPAFQELFDRYIPAWRRANLHLRHAAAIPTAEIRRAHEESKRAMLAEVKARTGCGLQQGRMTLGFARRTAPYKRMDLLFSDIDRLRAISRSAGPLQIVFAGKAHPRDETGKAMIRRVHEAARALGEDLPIVYLEEHDMELGRLLCGGADLWLNTPQRPQEASGTSGMKAALNGVPSLSVLDGWWVEGHVEGVTGWSIGENAEDVLQPEADAESLYDKLERTIVPMYYGSPAEYEQVMRSAIALNGSFFNAERMVFQYSANAYRL